MFRRRRRRTGGEAVDADTQGLAGVIHPGDTFPGQVDLRVVDHDTQIETIVLRAMAKYPDPAGGEEQIDEIGCEYADGPFGVQEGQEHRVPFSMRLPWETPITELAGRALGPVVELQTLLDDDDDDDDDDEGSEDGADHDLLNVSSLPLHEAVMDAFAAEEFVLQSCQLVGERVPDADQLFDFHQSFTLASRGRTVDRPSDLEVTFLTNAVGCEIFVRPAAPWVRSWDDKAPARRFIVAHHDVDRLDWLTEVRRWINEVALPAR